jgi:hypothetical protein
MLAGSGYDNVIPPLFRIAARDVVLGMTEMGLGFCAGSGYFLWRTNEWIATSATANGTVTAQASSMRTGGGPAGTPGRGGSRPTRAEVVEFTTPDGARCEFRSRISSSDPFPVGATVPVRYNPADPTDATIDTWFRIWGFPLIFLGVGVIELCVGVAFLAVSRRVGGPRGA